MLCMGWRYSALAQKDKALSTWIAFGAVFLSVISIQALLSRAFANWAAPGYITLDRRERDTCTAQATAMATVCNYR